MTEDDRVQPACGIWKASAWQVAALCMRRVSDIADIAGTNILDREDWRRTATMVENVAQRLRGGGSRGSARNN
jgi:hypothetical protein